MLRFFENLAPDLFVYLCCIDFIHCLLYRREIEIHTVSQKNVPTYVQPLPVDQIWTDFNKSSMKVNYAKLPTSHKICASTTLGNLKWQIELSVQYLHVYFNESLNSYNMTAVIVSKIVKLVVSHIIFASYARNVLHHERKHVNTGAT